MKLFTSTSADSQSIDAFLFILVAMVLEAAHNDIKPLATKLPTLSALSKDLLRSLGLFRLFNPYLNKFVLHATITDEDAVSVGKLLKANRNVFIRDTSIQADRLKLLQDCAQVLATDSDSAWDRVAKSVSTLHSPELSALFVAPVADTRAYKTIVKDLAAVVYKITNRPASCFLTPDEGKLAREHKPDLLAKYSPLVKELNKAIKTETLNYVRAQRSTLVSVDDLRTHLLSLGLQNNLPKGFTGGQIDEQGQAYTAEGRKLGRVPFGIVQMNPKYDPKTDNTYVMTGVNHAAAYRTLDIVAGRKKERHNLILEFLKDEQVHVKAWRADLDKSGSEDQVKAAMVELLYSTSCRIGGVGNATAGEPTYGLTTLKVEHIPVLTPQELIFDYAGKKLASQYTVYRLNTAVAKKIGAIFKAQMRNKGAQDLVFTFGRRHITRQLVSSYLKSLGINITPHNFRHLMGTKLVTKLLKNSPFKKSDFPKQAAVEAWFKEEAKVVGEALHHSTGHVVVSSTAIKSYIDPQIVEDFFVGLGLRRPKFLP